MTNIQQSLRKTDKHYLFEVQINWLYQNNGVLSAHDADGTIHVATPPVFGGEGKRWSPEHLLLGAVSSCFMTTFMAFAKKMSLTPSRLECNSIGRVELVEGKYRFTQVDIYPKIFTATVDDLDQAKKVLEKTQQYCLISHSLNAECIYHAEVFADPNPRFSVTPNDGPNYEEKEA